MTNLVEQHLKELKGLCLKHCVAHLELFGSATSDKEFDPAKSDIDFLVEFMPMSPSEHAKAYFGLLADLQDLFEKQIDLVEIKAVTNPYLIRVT
jgi:predicted nucleotidyltransferase